MALFSQRDHITALDLAGGEAHFPPELFHEHFQRARAAGWHVTSTPGRLPSRPQSGKPCAAWALNGLATPCPQSQIRS